MIEASAAFLVLSPIFWRWTRFLAALLLVGLHGGIALLVNLGVFSAAMIAFQPFLLTEAQWKLFARLVPRRGRARTVFYDADCGVCWAVVRVLARLDVHGRLRWLPNSDRAELPAGIEPALLAQSILVVDPQRDRRWTRAEAFAEILGALPFGRLWAWPMRLPGLRELAGLAYDAFARRRTTISTWLGLAACGVPSIVTGAPGSAEPRSVQAIRAAETPLGAWLREKTPLLRELGAAAVFIVLVAEFVVSNPGIIPRALRFERRPEWMVAAVMYPHITEAWALFAPEAPLTDETISVDAVTREGRHVDPYNEVASRVATVPIDDVPVRLGQVSFFFDYTLRIPSAGAYHQAFLEWLLRYPERTGRPGDAITSFDAFVVTHDSPKPDETAPTHSRKVRFLRWP